MVRTEIALGLNADIEQLKASVTAAASTVDRAPVNATIIETANGIEIRPDQLGLKTRVAATVQNLKQSIERGDAGTVELLTDTVPPSVKAADLQEITGLVAAFSTTFYTERRESVPKY